MTLGVLAIEDVTHEPMIDDLLKRGYEGGYCIGGMMCGKVIAGCNFVDGMIIQYLVGLPPNFELTAPQPMPFGIFENYIWRDGVWLHAGRAGFVG